MWIAFACIWMIGSASMYLYLYVTAQEAPNDECVECNLPDCAECPLRDAVSIRRAA